MVKRMIMERVRGKYLCGDIEMLDQKDMRAILNNTAIKILRELNKEPCYPNKLAKGLGLHEQKVYYHIRNMEKAGIIEVTKEEKMHGAVCKYYSPVATAFGIEVAKKAYEKSINEEGYEKAKEFFYEFIRHGFFDGSIVVGSPAQHGPYLTSSRDSHYAVQLAMFLGSFCEIPKKFIVKLDTEVKGEKAEKRNMILIGGPITNIISNNINKELKIKFIWENSWKIFSITKNKKYSNEDAALIAKIKNPFDKTKTVIVLAGLKFEGTKSCIIALTHFFDKTLKNYEKNKEFFRLIKGLDRDGDGKIDDIEIIE